MKILTLILFASAISSLGCSVRASSDPYEYFVKSGMTIEQIKAGCRMDNGEEQTLSLSKGVLVTLFEPEFRGLARKHQKPRVCGQYLFKNDALVACHMPIERLPDCSILESECKEPNMQWIKPAQRKLGQNIEVACECPNIGSGGTYPPSAIISSPLN